MPAPTAFTGTRPTPPPLLRPALIFPKFRGMTPAPANWSRTTKAIARPMARIAFATAKLARSYRRPSQVAEARAVARRGLRRPPASWVEAVRDGRNLRGNLSWATRTTACATLQTCRCLQPTDSGATTTSFVGLTRRMEGLLAAARLAAGPERA